MPLMLTYLILLPFQGTSFTYRYCLLLLTALDRMVGWRDGREGPEGLALPSARTST